jgi:hypothetical protein
MEPINGKVRAAMERESRRLTQQWRLSVSHERRSELARQICAISTLLGRDTQPRIAKLKRDLLELRDSQGSIAASR